MPEGRLFVVRPDCIVHVSGINDDMVRAADDYQLSLCVEWFAKGSWYNTPEGAVVTCFACIGLMRE